MRLGKQIRRVVSPTRYLAIVNLVMTGGYFLEGLIAARVLGPEQLGVVAVIGGINRTIVNFVDIRLTDVAGRLYYKTDHLAPESVPAYRAGVLALAIIGNTLLALIMTLLGIVIGWISISSFTKTPVPFSWIVAHAVMQSVVTITSTVVFLQRFLKRFHFFGTSRLIILGIELIIYFIFLLSIGGIDGYYTANVSSNLATLCLTLGVTLYIWVYKEKMPARNLHLRSTFVYYRQHGKFLFYGNLLGYAKLLQRSADILVVGFFANDYITGLYKLARTLTDGLYTLYDALNQVYQPHFLELLAERKTALYFRTAKRVFSYTVAGTAALVGLEAIALGPLLTFVLRPEYRDAAPTIILMTIPFGLVTGVFLWLWPIFVHSGDLGKYTVVAIIAAVLQQSVSAILFLSFPPQPAFAAIGYLAYYLFATPVVFYLGMRKLAQQPSAQPILNEVP